MTNADIAELAERQFKVDMANSQQLTLQQLGKSSLLSRFFSFICYRGMSLCGRLTTRIRRYEIEDALEPDDEGEVPTVPPPVSK